MKFRSTYINGKVGRSSVYLAKMDDYSKPPIRLTSYNKIEPGYKLKSNELYVMNTSFFECSADTKRWRSKVHVIPWNCLSGVTKVLLANGESKTLEELSDRTDQYKVLSYDLMRENQVIDTGYFSRYVGKRKAVQIELENGEVIRCTPDQLLLLKTGEWIEAGKLTLDNELADVYK